MGGDVQLSYDARALDAFTRIRLRGISWRGGLLALVFSAGFIAFAAGVGVSDRPHLVSSSLLAKCYYTLGLFVLGGMDLGTPVGGPDWARVLLWVSYFAAPAITASALIEGVVYVLQPQAWVLRRMRGHIVIAGCGRLAMLYMKKVRQVQPRTPIVVIEIDPDAPNLQAARDLYRARVLHADVGTEALWSRLRLEYAQRVLLLTGDDFANLEAASQILIIAPHLSKHTVVHVSDLRFMRAIAHTRVPAECQTFNTHHIAASHLVRSQMLGHFQSTRPRDQVVLAGFGRFGQTVLDELQQQARGAFHTVVIIDVEASSREAVFGEQVGFSKDYERHVIQGDLRDPRQWKALDTQLDFKRNPPFIVVGSGDDATNLRAALNLSANYPSAHIVARSFRQSEFIGSIAKESGVHAFAVADLVEESMPRRWVARRG